MTNKKLIFIVGCSRTGSTLLLSYLCGLKNTKILYETRCLTNSLNLSSSDFIDYLATMFNSITEDIVIEKTPEHCFYLNIIEQLRKVCKRDIHVIYVTRPPVPTILSILRAKEVWTDIDVLGACEKYEESMISIYHNLITKVHHPNNTEGRKSLYVYNWQDKLIEGVSYRSHVISAYSFSISYKSLLEDVYFTLYNLLVTKLHLGLSDSDIRSIVVNRVSNLRKVLPQVEKQLHHNNLFKEVDVVNKERLSNVSKLADEDKRNIKYINNYFTDKGNKFNIYDLVTKKEVISIDNVPLVTIVVPLYNKEKYIVDTLNSLLNQTYDNIRVVVVDDASTDKSLEVVEDYYRNLPYTFLQQKMCIVKKKSNQGVSSTRNIGISNLSSESDICSFCDADDIWDSTLVEKSVDTFKRYPYVDCVYSRVLLLKDGELIKTHSKICNGDVYEDSLEYNFLNCGSNIFVKASVLEQHNIRFNVEYDGCEDWDFLIQLAKVATFKCTKEYLVKYRQLSNSLSTNKELQVVKGKKILEKYLGVGASQTYRGEKYSRIFTRLFLYYFTIKNLKWSYIKDLDISYILRVVMSKSKACVKSHIL